MVSERERKQEYGVKDEESQGEVGQVILNVEHLKLVVAADEPVSFSDTIGKEQAVPCSCTGKHRMIYSCYMRREDKLVIFVRLAEVFLEHSVAYLKYV